MLVLLSPQKISCRLERSEGASLAILQSRVLCFSPEKLWHRVLDACEHTHTLLLFLPPLLYPSHAPRGLTFRAYVYCRLAVGSLPCLEILPTPLSFSCMKNYQAPPAQRVGKRGWMSARMLNRDEERASLAPNYPSFKGGLC